MVKRPEILFLDGKDFGFEMVLLARIISQGHLVKIMPGGEPGDGQVADLGSRPLVVIQGRRQVPSGVPHPQLHRARFPHVICEVHVIPRGGFGIEKRGLVRAKEIPARGAHRLF